MDVDALKNGMILAQDAVDRSGRVLLPKGTPLTDPQITKLKSWKLAGVEISGQAPENFTNEALAGLDPQIVAHCQGSVAMFFRLNQMDHPAVAELFHLAIRRCARALMDGAVIHNLDPNMIEEYIPLAAMTQEDLEVPPLSRLLKDEVQLTSFPAVYFRILQALENPYSSAGQLAEEVGQDTGLSAQLLKMVNSAYYGFMSKVDTIKKAITLVGTNELITLAMGLSVANQFKDIPPELMDMQAFWKHSLTCGLFARFLAKSSRQEHEERFFVAGMLHNLGRLILFKKLPQASTRAMLLAYSAPASTFEAEKVVLGYDHAMVGGSLLKEWKIPDTLVDMVRFHHRPEKSPDPMAAGIIHIADVMAVAFGIGDVSVELVPALSDKIWDMTSLSPAVFRRAFEMAQGQIDGILASFPKG